MKCQSIWLLFYKPGKAWMKVCRITEKSIFFLFILFVLLSAGCDRSSHKIQAEKKIGMVLDIGGDRDHGYNEYSLVGAKKAAEKAGIAFEYIVTTTRDDYDKNIRTLVEKGADLIFTIGFTQADATEKAARRYPDRHFAILDFAYSPGMGCPETVADCYTPEGGLDNVTSIVFKEDQPAFLGGVLAACMSESQTIGIIAGEKIPPVTRLVYGFINGARSINEGIDIKIEYIENFNDPDQGYKVARSFFKKGVDVLFCPAGKTGLGGLRAAAEFNVKALGVDVDQYLTVPEARKVLITSVMKNVDVAAGTIVQKYAAGSLKAGINAFDLKSHGVGLAPFHDWEDRIPQACRMSVARANKKVFLEPSISLPDE